MKSVFYVQFKAVYSTNSDQLIRIAATKVSQSRPQNNAESDLTVKFTVDIPEESIVPEVYASINTLGNTIQSLQETAKALK